MAESKTFTSHQEVHDHLVNAGTLQAITDHLAAGGSLTQQVAKFVEVVTHNLDGTVEESLEPVLNADGSPVMETVGVPIDLSPYVPHFVCTPPPVGGICLHCDEPTLPGDKVVVTALDGWLAGHFWLTSHCSSCHATCQDCTAAE